MTRVDMLEAYKAFAEEATHDLILPVSLQKGDAGQAQRAALVFKCRLPDSKQVFKKAPYIILQPITSKDDQSPGQELDSRASVRAIFAVYNPDEQEGGMALLNLMERLRVALLKAVVIDGRYELDLIDGIETIIYPDDTAPYYGGEMITTWKLPPIKREVRV